MSTRRAAVIDLFATVQTVRSLRGAPLTVAEAWAMATGLGLVPPGDWWFADLAVHISSNAPFDWRDRHSFVVTYQSGRATTVNHAGYAPMWGNIPSVPPAPHPPSLAALFAWLVLDPSELTRAVDNCTAPRLVWVYEVKPQTRPPPGCAYYVYPAADVDGQFDPLRGWG